MKRISFNSLLTIDQYKIRVMKIKYLLAICLFIGASGSVFSQEEEQPKQGFDKSRLFVGGTIGLSFGDYTFVNVSPQLGYMFNRYLAAGAGINGIYSSSKTHYTGVTEEWEYGVIGLNVFGRVYPVPFAFAQLQPEANYVWETYTFHDNQNNTKQEDKRGAKMIPCLLAGVGAAIPAGRSGAFTIMAQYDLLQNDRSPYSENVFFSFGFNFGL